MPRRKPGRPRVAIAAKRRHLISLRVTTRELRQIQSLAKRHGEAVSTFVRQRVLTSIK